MRILIVSNLYPPHVLGGYELACRNVAVALRDRGHDVDVFSSWAPVSTNDDPPWVHRGMALKGWLALQVPPQTVDLGREQSYETACSQYANTAALLRQIQEFKPDVVYLWYIWGVGGLGLLDLLEQLGVPWIIHLMDAVPTRLLTDVDMLPVSLFARSELALLSRASVIAMSEQVLAEIAETTGLRFETPPEMIPGWVDTKGLGQRRRYRLGGLLRLVAASSLGTHKGTDLILHGSAKLVSEGYLTFTVDIYGLSDPEPWIALAEDLGVSDRVRFRNPLPQKALLEALPQYDCLLFPTQIREPFGFAPIEAAACGVVPILTRNAGAAERLVDGVHAVKIDRSADGLAEAIRSLLDGELDVAAIGRRAARYVRHDLNFERCVDAIERTLQRRLHPWDVRRAADRRLAALLFAKHELGRYLTFAP
jgi:glycosyltransferase involved in cell wall biosynthesis